VIGSVVFWLAALALLYFIMYEWQDLRKKRSEKSQA
jgi:hypothetical protein